MMVLEEILEEHCPIEQTYPKSCCQTDFQKYYFAHALWSKAFVVFLYACRIKIPNPKVVIQSHKFFSNFFSLIPHPALSKFRGGLKIGIQAPTVIQQRCYLNPSPLPLRGLLFIFIYSLKGDNGILFSSPPQIQEELK